MGHREGDGNDPGQQAVEASREPNNLKAARVELGELDRDVVRFGPRVEQDHLLEGVGEDLGQPFGQGEHGLGQHPRVQVDRFVKRTPDRSSDPGMIVPDGGADLPRGEVEDAAAIRRLDPGPVRASDRQRSEAACVANEEALPRVVHPAPSLSMSITGRMKAISEGTAAAAGRELRIPPGTRPRAPLPQRLY